MVVPVLVELDGIDGESTGTVHPFCNITCLSLWESKQEEKHARGIGSTSDFADDPVCVQCGKPLIPLEERKFKLLVNGGPDDNADVLGGEVEWGNPYISLYTTVIKGDHKQKSDLRLGETTIVLGDIGFHDYKGEKDRLHIRVLKAERCYKFREVKDCGNYVEIVAD